MPRGKKKAAEVEPVEIIFPQSKKRRTIDSSIGNTPVLSPSKSVNSKNSQETNRRRSSTVKTYCRVETCLTRSVSVKAKVKDLNVWSLMIMSNDRYGIRNDVKNGLMDIVSCMMIFLI
jgi:hypothetical protein